MTAREGARWERDGAERGQGRREKYETIQQ